MAVLSPKPEVINRLMEAGEFTTAIHCLRYVRRYRPDYEHTPAMVRILAGPLGEYILRAPESTFTVSDTATRAIVKSALQRLYPAVADVIERYA